MLIHLLTLDRTDFRKKFCDISRRNSPERRTLYVQTTASIVRVLHCSISVAEKGSYALTHGGQPAPPFFFLQDPDTRCVAAVVMDVLDHIFRKVLRDNDLVY